MKVTVIISKIGLLPRGHIKLFTIPPLEYEEYTVLDVMSINDKGKYIELTTYPESVYVNKETLVEMVVE